MLLADDEVIAGEVAATLARADDIARRAAARDDAAWSQLFEAHYRHIYAFVRYRLQGAAEAEDIAAQVFEVAYSRADSFDYRGLPIEAWLMGIARNLVRDHVKKRARRGTPAQLDEMAAQAPDDTRTVDLRRDLARAMEGLTDDQQTVLALRFLMDRPVAETAVLMGRSEDAVKNLQRRALASLRRVMETDGTKR